MEPAIPLPLHHLRLLDTITGDLHSPNHGNGQTAVPIDLLLLHIPRQHQPVRAAAVAAAAARDPRISIAAIHLPHTTKAPLCLRQQTRRGLFFLLNSSSNGARCVRRFSAMITMILQASIRPLTVAAGPRTVQAAMAPDMVVMAPAMVLRMAPHTAPVTAAMGPPMGPIHTAGPLTPTTP